MATSLVAELAEKLSSATNNFDIDESTIFVNTSADTVGIGTTSPSAKLDVRGSAIFNEGGLDADFRIEGDTETHLFFLDASTGRVGINSATPGVRFDVVGATKITGALTVGVDDTGHDVKFFGASAGAFMLYDESADTLEIRGPSADASTSTGKLLLSTALTDINDGDVLGRIDFKAPLEAGGTDAILVGASIYAEADDTFAADNNATELVFATGASEAAVEKVRITSDGKVGIGTSTPDTALSVAGLTTGAAIAIQAYTTTATQGSQLFLARSNNGTLGTQTAVDADDLLGGISFQGSYGSAFGTGAQIRGFADETFSGTAVGSTLRFYTADNTTTTLDERMRIDHNGKVGIGTTAPTEMLEIYNAASPSIQLNDGGDYQALFKLVGNDLEIRGSNGHLEFYTGNADGDSSSMRVAINSTGHTSFAGNIRQLKLGRDPSGTSNASVVQHWITTNGTDGTDGTYSYADRYSYGPSASVMGAFRWYSTSGTGQGDAVRLEILTNGTVSVAGAFTKGSGSFKIDHPLESKSNTHDLVHSFIEGPQADNIYRGKVTLVAGKATVNIDTVSNMTEGTFVALNTDTQCFTTNETGWDSVKGSVSGNILTITAKKNTSTDTISWMVVGERQDQTIIDSTLTDSDGKIIVEPEKETL